MTPTQGADRALLLHGQKWKAEQTVISKTEQPMTIYGSI